ncbi:hypothetical protein BXZ70DRAFT_789561 [Cristinia sonorae]|uniref:Pentatricopeptide repeat protein n=1 Tax=Cristinia sonorae TaxID=1940300 RepID=A0A8K0XRG4_9AGAR|nr:hypothetical protein BXZ70DRAFT_789561 [Cristinia sonorae]
MLSFARLIWNVHVAAATKLLPGIVTRHRPQPLPATSAPYIPTPAGLVCPCMLQHASRTAKPSSFFTVLHAAAGRAFARASNREYHQRRQPFRQAELVVPAPKGYAEDQLATFWADLSGASTSRSTLSPVSHYRQQQPRRSVSTSREVVTTKPALGHYRKLTPLPHEPASKREIDASQTVRLEAKVRRATYTYRTIDRPLRPIHPETLSVLDTTYKDCALAPLYEDDPPWLDAVPLGGWTSAADNDAAWMPNTSMRPATSPRSHFRNLLVMQYHQIPSPSIHDLVAYHDTYPSFRSVMSFNLLLELAIRISHFNLASRLFTQMEEQGLVGNLDTRKLRARHFIRRGQWEFAWRREMDTVGPMPLAVWMEFFGTPLPFGHGARRVGGEEEDALDGTPSNSRQADKPTARTAESHSAEIPDREGTKYMDITTNLARFDLLMHNLPRLEAHQRKEATPRVARCIISLLLRSGQFELAEKITMDFFGNLQVVSRKDISKCLDIMHLHLGQERLKGREEYVRLSRLFRRMIGAHSSFRPTAHTLCLLLRPLKDAMHGGTVAWRVVERFRKKWGNGVVDERVRRRVASLARKEGRMDLVERVAREEGQRVVERGMWDTEREVRGGPESGHGDPLRRLRLGARELVMFSRGEL